MRPTRCRLLTWQVLQTGNRCKPSLHTVPPGFLPYSLSSLSSSPPFFLSSLSVSPVSFLPSPQTPSDLYLPYCGENLSSNLWIEICFYSKWRCNLAIQNSVCSHNTYMLKYSEVNRANEKQQELLFKWRQNLFLSNIKSRKVFGKGYGGEDRAGRRLKVILPNV